MTNPEQMYLLFYEDKHDNEIDVYGDKEAIETAQRSMMEDPERTFAATVAITEQQYEDVAKLVYDDKLDDAWTMFVEICRESEIYLRIETRTVSYSGTVGSQTGRFNSEGTVTGRFSSTQPNQSNTPKADKSVKR